MEIGELKKLLDAIFENPKIEHFAQTIAGILSYLKSEQEKRIELTKAMQELREDLYGAKENTGLKHRLKAIEDRGERNGKLMVRAIAGVCTLLIAEVIRIAMVHVKFN